MTNGGKSPAATHSFRCRGLTDVGFSNAFIQKDTEISRVRKLCVAAGLLPTLRSFLISLVRVKNLLVKSRACLRYRAQPPDDRAEENIQSLCV